MDFNELYRRDLMFDKKLEIKWFHNKIPHGPQHTMPFLSRNLVYVRRANDGRRRPTQKTSPITTTTDDEDKSKKVDVLWSVFKYRTVLYNDALLTSPRRATRKLIEASSRSASKPAESKKRSGKLKNDKLDSDDDDSSMEVDSVTQNLEQLLAANSKKRRTSVSPLSSSDDDESSMKRTGRPKTGGNTYLSTSQRAETKLYFHLPFIDENGVPAVHTDEGEKEGRRCPLCFLDAVSDSGLLMHCLATHGIDFDFSAARNELGELHISVNHVPKGTYEEKEQLKDFCFVASSADRLSPVHFVERSASKIAVLEPVARKKKARTLEEMGATDEEVQRFTLDDKVPVRQYYHSKTIQPMLGGEWAVDSDEESTDDKWLKDFGDLLIDDFEDVSADEKKFFKLWNGYMKSLTLISDRSIPARCLEFVRMHAADLSANNLRNNLTLHLYNLWDSKLVTKSHITECMVEYNSLVS